MSQQLASQLGLVAGHRFGIDNPPREFIGLTLMPVPTGVSLHTRIAGNMDIVLGFYERRRDFEERLPVLQRRIPEGGAIWIAWPKQASGVKTDMTEEVVRAVALPAGMVDDRTCAIDEVWTALRLVVPTDEGS